MKKVLFIVIPMGLLLFSLSACNSHPKPIETSFDSLQNRADSLVHYYVEDLDFAEAINVTVLDSAGNTIVSTMGGTRYATHSHHTVGSLVYPVLLTGIDSVCLSQKLPAGFGKFGEYQVHDSRIVLDSNGHPIDSLTLADALMYSSQVGMATFVNGRRKVTLATVARFFPEVELTSQQQVDSGFFRVSLGDFTATSEMLLSCYKQISDLSSPLMDTLLSRSAANKGIVGGDISGISCMYIDNKTKDPVNVFAGYTTDTHRYVFLVAAYGCKTDGGFVADLVSELFNNK